MKARTRAEIAAAPAQVRQLWTVSPAAARQHVADRRMFAQVHAETAETGEDLRVAAALHLAADAADTELARLGAATDAVTAVFDDVLALVGPPPGWAGVR
ncbi:hypothetical protein [Dactylosporangium salmoneum]|uniref:Uncharacterized protein n=1 Tax=Dactylosporangium salmoneum TaxID=53361 RepID=A0ABP5T6L0_9ACTN